MNTTSSRAKAKSKATARRATKAMRHYVVTVYGPPPHGQSEAWFEELLRARGAPAGTYGCGAPSFVLGFTVASVAEAYTGPFVLGQSWVYPTYEAAEREARRRRRHGLALERQAHRRRAG